VQRALPALQGRRPYGVREVRLLADIVDQLDAAGADGRRLVAEGLAQGPGFARRWTLALADHLGAIRSGHRHRPRCLGRATAAGDDPALAAFVRDHDPEDMSEAPGWTMTDLYASALALDDLRPLLRAHLLVRAASPIDGNNVDPADLEAARRRNFAAGFEARLLGRRRECVACHADEASVTDADDPAADRFWPLAAGWDRAVFGELPPDDAALDAVFRHAGAVGGPLAPWGVSADCVTLAPGRDGDLLGVPAHLAGELPPGATVLDLDRRLRAGMDALVAAGLAADLDPPRALAAEVAAHLADGAWAEVAGAPLTLAHGHPRSAAARDVLAGLTAALVDGGFSPRALAVAVVTHPALDVADACDAALPPLLDPWAPAGAATDRVHRPSPWLLLDTAHHALGWPLARAWSWPYGYPDEPLLARLGVALDEVELGARSSDLVGQLAWEATYAPGRDPGLGDPATEPDWVDRLLAVAAADPGATLGDLAAACADRLLAEPDLSRGTADAHAAVLGHALATRAADLDPAELDAAVRRLVGALLATPQFLLHGRAPPPAQGAPRLVVPGADTRALCEAHARTLLDPGAWTIACDDAGARVSGPRSSSAPSR
jgi:hypothetical protein